MFSFRNLARRQILQTIIPAVGAQVWIRQSRWRLESWRRQRNVLRLDVRGRRGRLTVLAPFDRPCFAASSRIKRIRSQEFRARFASLAGRETSYRALSSPVDASLQVLPFQLEPALAILGGARRVLIADEVGLGKTIQAGLLIAELRQRDPACRALILTPSNLRRQWIDELRHRFNLGAWEGGPDASHRLATLADRGDAPWDRAGVWIASLDYVKQPHVVDGLPHRPWDLLVIDEAHGVCGDSGRHGVADALARRSRRLLLLTATPHSGDESRFERLLDLGALPCAGDDVLVFRRTRAGLGASNGRRVRWHAVSLTAEEVRLHDVLAGFEGAVLHAAGEGRRDAALLLLSVFRKRALSTIAAFLLSVERRLSWLDASGSVDPQPWRQGDLDFDESADDLSTEERIAIDADIGLGADRERSWLRRLIDLGRAASRHDSKIRRVVALARRSTEPLALFTEFKDSLDVLAARLRPLHRIATLHGRLTADEQQEQIDRFLDGSASILLATDVASQGLNLQSRCRWIVNLELPWNPAKLEQRAGRVDRIGQRRSVHISLLVARHGTEADVLLRLARRALSAQQTFGSEMLGVTAPDEHVLRAHLLSSAPLPPPEPPRRRVAFCRKWSRPARAAAQRLRRQKSLASHWRGHLPASRPGVSRLDRLAGLRAIAGDTSLVLFSVPLMSGSGTRLEHRLVMIRVPATALHAPRGLDRLREVATMSLHPRVRRLRRLRNSERDGAVSRERAIADALAAPFRPAAYQAGLFDRRGLLADTRAARVLERIARDLDDRLLGIDTDCAVEIGIPILELIALPPR